MVSLQIYKKTFILLIGLFSSHAFIVDRRAVPNDFRKGFALKRFNEQPFRRSSKSHLGMIPIVEAIFEPYSRSLEEFPVITKAMTGFVLCGVADVIAQVRGNESRDTKTNSNSMFGSNTLRDINIQRLSRFASKGFFGAIIWGAWYDISADFISENNIAYILSETGIRDSDSISSTVLNVLRTISAITIEQFLACPIIFGLWEIPAATLLNNAPVKRIPYEIEDKLNNMLIANAKVWTIANLIIYNIPVQYRVGLANVIDIFWQSIVSDFAADCGGPIEECQLDENTEENALAAPLRNPVVVEDMLVTKSTQ